MWKKNHFHDQVPNISSHKTLCRSHHEPIFHVFNQLRYPGYSQKSTFYNPSLSTFTNESSTASAKQRSTLHYHTPGKYFS